MVEWIKPNYISYSNRVVSSCPYYISVNQEEYQRYKAKDGCKLVEIGFRCYNCNRFVSGLSDYNYNAGVSIPLKTNVIIVNCNLCAVPICKVSGMVTEDWELEIPKIF